LTAQCKNASTSCRKAPIEDDYYSKSIIRSGYLNINRKDGAALGFIFYGKEGAKE